VDVIDQSINQSISQSIIYHKQKDPNAVSSENILNNMNMNMNTKYTHKNTSIIDANEIQRYIKKVSYRKQIARQHSCHNKFWSGQMAWSIL